MMEKTREIKTPLCSACGKEMNFDSGDTIYGDKWYHKDCANSIKIKIN